LQEVLAGLVVALLVSMLAGHFYLSSPKRQRIFRRIGFGIIYFFRFLLEVTKANWQVALLVVNPVLPIKPGIIKIKTKLKKDSSITMLANSITLTPGTLTIDVNPKEKELYIHWINTTSKDIEEDTRIIGEKFEKILMEVVE